MASFGGEGIQPLTHIEAFPHPDLLRTSRSLSHIEAFPHPSLLRTSRRVTSTRSACSSY